MTIIEALKSGKPFKRNHWSCYYTKIGEAAYNSFTVDDILANDWEIKTEPRIIWVNIYPGDKIFNGVHAYNTKQEADDGADKSTRIACKKFIEVIE